MLTKRLNRRGITLVEVIVVLAIVILLIGLMPIASQSAREAGRRTYCINKMSQLGIAMHTYASAHNTFPASSGMTGPELSALPGSNSSEQPRSVNGYSFLVKMLPYTEYNRLYKSLKPDGNPLELLASKDKATVEADMTKIPDFLCPSNNNNSFLKNDANPPTGALTNYKAMSASTEASLVMCVDPTGKPPYGTAELHPDGAIYPGKDIPLADFVSDGLSHTIMLMETQDNQYSRWLVGAEASLVGLPPTRISGPDKAYTYYYPTKYDGTFGDSSAIAQAGIRTFLEYDFSPTGPDYGAYAKDKAGDPGWDTTIPNTYMYGPSSAHPAIVVAGFADGCATGLNKRCDAANMFFLITRQNGDPFNMP